MNGLVLLGKELRELWRTHRVLTVGIVLVVFAGMMSPPVARFAPELVKSLTSSAAPGISIEIPEPTVADAIGQFLKNLTQVGAIVVILVAMGAIALERERKTAALVLSKPVSRFSFLLAKFVALTLLLELSVILAGLACWAYTRVLFGAFEPAMMAQVSLLAGLYLWVLLAMTFLCSSLFKSQIAAGGLAFGAYVGLSLLGIIPGLRDYLPGALLEGAGRLALGAPADAGGASIVSLAIVALCVAASWWVFKGHEL